MAATIFNPSHPEVLALRKNMLNGLKQKLFLWAKLPGAAFMGCHIESITDSTVAVSLPYGWRSQNPFQSIYFAAQCAAAELSTGILAMQGIQGRGVGVSMLVGGMQASFIKKATTKTTFTCAQGQAVLDAIQRAIDTGEGQTVTVTSTGVQASGEVVSEFQFTWSFKTKKSR